MSLHHGLNDLFSVVCQRSPNQHKRVIFIQSCRKMKTIPHTLVCLRPISDASPNRLCNFSTCMDWSSSHHSLLCCNALHWIAYSRWIGLHSLTLQRNGDLKIEGKSNSRLVTSCCSWCKVSNPSLLQTVVFCTFARSVKSPIRAAVDARFPIPAFCKHCSCVRRPKVTNKFIQTPTTGKTGLGWIFQGITLKRNLQFKSTWTHQL